MTGRASALVVAASLAAAVPKVHAGDCPRIETIRSGIPGIKIDRSRAEDPYVEKELVLPCDGSKTDHAQKVKMVRP